MFDLTEVLGPHAQQRRAIDLGIAVDLVMDTGMKRAPVPVEPRFVGLVLVMNTVLELQLSRSRGR